MNLKNTLLSIFMLISMGVFSQKQHTQSFGFVSDNDVYISATQDQYYTNGLTLEYRFIAPQKHLKVFKKINTFSLGQYMYSPFRPNVPLISQQDRPFAGYLFADFSTTKFYKNESAFKLTYQLGILGPSAGGESLQKWYHRLFNLPPINGWEFQIQNQLGLNVNAYYLRNLGYTKSDIVDFNAFAQTRVGTIFNDVSIGFVSRIGFKSLNPIFNSVLFNSNLSDKKSDKSIKEAYFFIKPQLMYVLYNATIQGSMFNNDSPLTFKSEPLKASLQFGIKWTSKRLNFGYSVRYLTKAVDNNKVTAHKYGTINLGYRFNEKKTLHRSKEKNILSFSS